MTSDSSTPKSISPSASDSPEDKPADLKIEDVKVGNGKEALKGKTAKANFFGTLADGTKIDKFDNPSSPFRFLIGSGQVIRGLDQGIVGMKAGGKRRLVIPPSLAYGREGQGIVPPNSTITYEVELVDVQ